MNLRRSQTPSGIAKFGIAKPQSPQKRIDSGRPHLDSAGIQKSRQGLGGDPFGEGHFPFKPRLHQAAVRAVKSKETSSAIEAGLTLPERSIADELFDASTCITQEPSRCLDDGLSFVIREHPSRDTTSQRAQSLRRHFEFRFLLITALRHFRFLIDSKVLNRQ